MLCTIPFASMYCWTTGERFRKDSSSQGTGRPLQSSQLSFLKYALSPPTHCVTHEDQKCLLFCSPYMGSISDSGLAGTWRPRILQLRYAISSVCVNYRKIASSVKQSLTRMHVRFIDLANAKPVQRKVLAWLDTIRYVNQQCGKVVRAKRTHTSSLASSQCISTCSVAVVAQSWACVLNSSQVMFPTGKVGLGFGAAIANLGRLDVSFIAGTPQKQSDAQLIKSTFDFQKHKSNEWICIPKTNIGSLLKF